MPTRLAQACAAAGLGGSMVGARRPGMTPAAPRALPPGRLARVCAVVGLGEGRNGLVGARRPGMTPATPRALLPGRLAQACAVVGLGEGRDGAATMPFVPANAYPHRLAPTARGWRWAICKIALRGGSIDQGETVNAAPRIPGHNGCPIHRHRHAPHRPIQRN